MKSSKEPQHFELEAAWKLVNGYWKSEQKWSGFALLIVIAALALAVVKITLAFNLWSGDFYNAVSNRNASALPTLLERMAALIALITVVPAFQNYFQQMLQMRWRTWLTEHMVKRWLSNDASYRIDRDQLVDNPDQRIAEDINSFIETTIKLSLGACTTIATLVAFSSLLWTLSGYLRFEIGQWHVAVPGYMFWCALIYAVISSLVAHWINRPLVNVNFRQQKVEADFRYLLVQIRDNAEQISMLRGSELEQERLKASFAGIRANWKQVMKYSKSLLMVQGLFGDVTAFVPALILAPAFFSGALALGTMMRINSAFVRVSSSLSFFMQYYEMIALWRSVVRRLVQFEKAVDAQESKGIKIVETCGARIVAHTLTLKSPDGRNISEIGNFSIGAGERWMIKGESGAGKSTLLRALVGIWPFGQGTVDTPQKAAMFFMPQRNYVPTGTLKQALCYPAYESEFADADCREALCQSQLGDYVNRLHEMARWGTRLSPGEQQRVGFARIFLHRPDCILLDESTSALDPRLERLMYERLIEGLPHATVVSVAHRASLGEFHEYVLSIGAGIQDVVTS